VVLAPFLGFIDQSFWRYSFVEDHLQYLAGMGPLALVGAGMAWLVVLVIPARRMLQSTLGAAVLLTLAIASWGRSCAYESEETLWIDAIAKNPSCWVGYNNLGAALLNRGQLGAAMARFQKAIEINPNYAGAYNNLGNALLQKGQVDEAIQQFRNALKLSPNFAQAYYNLGNALLQKGQVVEAIQQYQIALKINPNYSEARNNLGNVYLQIGQVGEAVAQFQEALRLQPDNAIIQKNFSKAQAMAQQAHGLK